MRLQEVYYICRTAKESWDQLSFNEVNEAGSRTYYKVRNPDKIRDMLLSLETIESFRELVVSIRSYSYGFSQITGEIIVDLQTQYILSSNYQMLYNKIVAITDMFDSLNYRLDSDGFDIKLPNQMTLSELSKCTHDLEIIFSVCPLFKGQSSTITFSAVDVGSIWLAFGIVGATIIINNVAELVDKAIIIRSHYLTQKMQEEQLRSLQLSNEERENFIKVQKILAKNMLNQETDNLAIKHDITDPEDKERLKASLQLLSDWMCKGLEVYASVQAPPEVKAIFPPIEKQTLPEKVVALLSGTSIDEE